MFELEIWRAWMIFSLSEANTICRNIIQTRILLKPRSAGQIDFSCRARFVTVWQKSHCSAQMFLKQLRKPALFLALGPQAALVAKSYTHRAVRSGGWNENPSVTSNLLREVKAAVTFMSMYHFALSQMGLNGLFYVEFVISCRWNQYSFCNIWQSSPRILAAINKICSA